MGLTGDVSVVFLSDRQIRQYNRKFLRHDRPTDVISFDLGGTPPLRDILISLDTAGRQAREIGHPLVRELKILAIHGLLHLTGYDDRNAGQRKKMWRETDRLLKMVEDL